MKRHINRSFSAGLVVICAVTAARADVAGTGDFQTSIPIDVPTMRGVSPTVRLAYAANAPNGIAGVGWSLDATSMISRTGPRGGLSVAPAAPDGFALDGEPLIPCTTASTSPSCTTAQAAWGDVKGVYSTRRESFARIKYETATTWKVWSTSGHVSEYVTRDGGQSWLLDHTTDRHGNAIKYSYACAPGADCELTAINYGDHAVAGAEVHFYYEARPDTLRRSNGKATLTVDRRLRSIAVFVGGRLARAYGFEYQSGFSQRSILSTVTQYAADSFVDADGAIKPGATAPLPWTTFTMGGGIPNTRTAPITAEGLFAIGDLPRNPSPPRFADTYVKNLAERTPTGDGETWKRAPFESLIGDFDGDSRTDFINVYQSKKCQTIGVTGVMARKNSFQDMSPREIATDTSAGTNCAFRSWVADIDGDHRDDLITRFRDRLYVSRFNGKWFVVDPVVTPWTLSGSNCAVGDVDGDVRDDLLCLVDQGGTKLVTARSRGDATWNVTSLAIIAQATAPFAVGDINNDGLADAIVAPDVGGTRSLLTLTSYGLGYLSDLQATPWAVNGNDRLIATDVDGDGLGDLALTRKLANSLPDELALAVEGAPTNRYELRTLPYLAADFGDVDGDGRVDLIKGQYAYLGDGTGTFSAPVTVFPAAGCSSSYFTDTDGDGRTELLCVVDDDLYFKLDDFAPATPARDLHRWMSGDIDGDGRADYVYAYAMNPGVGVRTVLTSSNQRVAWQQLPTTAIPGLDDSSPAHWMLADVGGPNGTPDGRDDLVMVDTDGAALRVYTMLSNGDGKYTPHIETNLSVVNANDLGNYWPLDVDGNGTTDLVHLAPSAGSGVRLDVLLSRGDGQWTAAPSRYYFAGATPRIVGATSFKPADVNGDGLTDLVHIYSGAGVTGTAIRVLVNRGDGTFGEVSNVIAMTYTDTSHWMPLDINGDGTTDFVHATSATSASGSGVLFESLLSRGDGVFTPGSIGTAWLDASARPDLRRALESTAFLVPADLDGDRDIDLWHISQYRDAGGARRTLFVWLLNTNGGTQWQAIASMPTTIPGSAPWAWRSYRDASRTDGTGLALIDGNAGIAYLRDLPSERIGRIDNGTGGATTIAYQTLLGSRMYLPSGMLPTVVTEVSKLDYAYSPTLTARTSYRYHSAKWSDVRQAMTMGWIEASDPRTTIATMYETGDECGGTPLMFVTYDSPTQVALSFTQRALVAPGNAPHTCLVQQQATFECAIGGSCRRNTLVDLTHDQYGNVAEAREQVTDGPTRVDRAPVEANKPAYIVDLPMYRELEQDNGNGSERLRLDEFIYDGNSSARDPVGPLGEVRTVRHWDSTRQGFLESHIAYDSTGLVIRTEDPQGLWIETSYDQAHHTFPESSCSALGCVSSQWDTRFGVETERIDLDSLKTHYDYDAHGRLVTTTTPDGGSKTSRILAHGIVNGVPTNQRQRARVEVKDGSADGVLWSETLIDGSGRGYRTIKEGGATQIREYTDASDRPSRVSEVFGGASTSRYVTFTYDALGRMTERRAPDGSRRRWTFRPGEVDTIDELGRKRTLAMDGRGEVTAVTERLAGSDIVTSYGYDAAHRLVGTTDHLGNTTSYYFDTLGQLIGESDPDRGLREYTYTRNGRLRTSTDAKGQQIEYRYDQSGRPTERSDQDANGDITRTVRWTYDELPGAGTQGASRGRVVRVEDEQGKFTRLQSTYHYDLGGRVDTDERCIDGTCFTMNRRFDIAGRLAELTYPDANNFPDERVGHDYNDAGQLVKVGGYLVNATYTIDGLTDTMKVGNGIETRWTRDPVRRWIDSVDVSNTYQASYKRDLTGAIENLDEIAPTGKLSYQYRYDDLGRMTDAYASVPGLERHFTYDEIGRITHHSELGTYDYDDPAHAHAVTRTDGGAERQYDANGNTTYLLDPNGRALEIGWTVDDRPARFDGSGGRYDMVYDVTGARVKKTGATNASYFHPYVTIENNELVKYYFAGDTMLARQQGGKVTYYHQDHVRAVRATTDDAGAVVNSYRYDAFGAPLARNTQNMDDVAFGTVHGDSDMDLVYMNARYYDPIAARFLSADSVVRDAYSPQSLDRYAYVEGDPVNYIDPSGHMRRNVELMKERKEMWRSLMVEFEKRSQEYCAPFCARAVTSTVVLYTEGGDILQVWRPGDDADLAMESWSFIHEMHQENLIGRAAAHSSTSSSHDDGGGGSDHGGGASDKAGGGGGGLGGGCGVRSIASCGVSLVLGAPKRKEVEIEKGTTNQYDIEITQGVFAGTTVTFTVSVDAYGKVVDANASCDGTCPANFNTVAKVQGQFVSATLTSENGQQTSVNTQASDMRTNNKFGGELGTTSNMSLETGAKGTAGIIDVDGKLTGQFGTHGKLDASKDWTNGANNSSTLTVQKTANVTNHVVILRLVPVGSDPPPAVKIMYGKEKRK